MALIVEDGSIVANADSYISLDDARALAVKWGLKLPSDNDEAEVALRKAAVYYIGLKEDLFTGNRVSDSQSLSWPREEATRFGVDLADDSIHPDIQLAQVEAAAVYGSGTEVRPADDGRQVTSESIGGAMSISYKNTSDDNNIAITQSDDLLNPFLSKSATYTNFEVCRA